MYSKIKNISSKIGNTKRIEGKEDIIIVVTTKRIKDMAKYILKEMAEGMADGGLIIKIIGLCGFNHFGRKLRETGIKVG